MQTHTYPAICPWRLCYRDSEDVPSGGHDAGQGMWSPWLLRLGRVHCELNKVVPVRCVGMRHLDLVVMQRKVMNKARDGHGRSLTKERRGCQINTSHTLRCPRLYRRLCVVLSCAPARSLRSTCFSHGSPSVWYVRSYYPPPSPSPLPAALFFSPCSAFGHVGSRFKIKNDNIS